MPSFLDRVLFPAIVFFLFTPAASAQSADDATGTIMVIAQGCTTDAGRVRLELARAEEGFDAGNGFRAAAVPVRDGTATHAFENIPYGTYAVRLFHDANDNGELDTNFMGISEEAYGFSNDARDRFGPPSFDEAAFVLDADSLTITINVR